MRIDLIFDPAFVGSAEKAVWIIDTATNRKWFAEQDGLDPNSAIFFADHYPTIDAAVVQMIRNAQEHHPAWSHISVVGVTLTPSIRDNLEGNEVVNITSTGFDVSK